MTIEEAITTYLSGYAGLTALVGDKIYPDTLPDGVEYPAVVYQKISDIPDRKLDGQQALRSPNFQIEAWDTTKAKAIAIGNQIEAALNDYKGTLSGIEIQEIALINDMSGFESVLERKDKIYYCTKEYTIFYIKI